MSKDMQWSEILSTAITKPGVVSKAYSAFHNYSIGNQLAALGQCYAREIPLGPIATYEGWRKLGRQVRKGEKAISLCRPVTVKTGDKDSENGERAKSFFMWKAYWFVMAQTDGPEFVNEVPVPQWDRTAALVSLGITEAPFNYPDGNCQGYATGQSIAVNPVAEHPHKTRFHEIAHVVLGHTRENAMTDSERTPRDIREVEAESVAYILISLLDLPGQVESRGYIQNWLDGQAIPEKSAQRIFSAADKIRRAGQTVPVED